MKVAIMAAWLTWTVMSLAYCAREVEKKRWGLVLFYWLLACPGIATIAEALVK